MQPTTQYAPGFIPVEEAIALINKDTRDNATVDLQFLTNNIPYLKVNHNYNIRLLKTVAPNKHEYAGERFVTIRSKYEMEVLKKAILDKFAEATGQKLNADTYGINKITTTIDQETEHSTGQPRVDTTSKTSFGQDISKPYEEVLQGV